MYLNEDDMFVMSKTLKMLKSTLRRQSKKLTVSKFMRISLTKKLNKVLNTFPEVYSLEKPPEEERKYVIFISSQEYKKIENYVDHNVRLHPDESMFATTDGAFDMESNEMASVDIAIKKEDFLSPFEITKNSSLIQKSKKNKDARMDYIRKDCSEIQNLNY